MAVATTVEIEAGNPTVRIEALLLDFLAYLEFERGLARNTLAAYRTDLLQFGEFLAARSVDPVEASGADVADFLADLARGGEDRAASSAATLNRKIACLRSFYRHLRRAELIDADPTASIRPPRKGRTLPKVLSYPEVQRLLETAKESSRPAFVIARSSR